MFCNCSNDGWLVDQFNLFDVQRCSAIDPHLGLICTLNHPMDINGHTFRTVWMGHTMCVDLIQMLPCLSKVTHSQNQCSWSTQMVNRQSRDARFFVTAEQVIGSRSNALKREFTGPKDLYRSKCWGPSSGSFYLCHVAHRVSQPSATTKDISWENPQMVIRPNVFLQRNLGPSRPLLLDIKSSKRWRVFLPMEVLKTERGVHLPWSSGHQQLLAKWGLAFHIFGGEKGSSFRRGLFNHTHLMSLFWREDMILCRKSLSFGFAIDSLE